MVIVLWVSAGWGNRSFPLESWIRISIRGQVGLDIENVYLHYNISLTVFPAPEKVPFVGSVRNMALFHLKLINCVA